MLQVINNLAAIPETNKLFYSTILLLDWRFCVPKMCSYISVKNRTQKLL